MCVDIVEAFLPVFPDPDIWKDTNQYVLGKSKCDKLAGAPMPPDLASSVDYNPQQARATLANTGHFPPYIVAMGYCLGTTHVGTPDDPDVESEILNVDPWNWRSALQRVVGPGFSGGTELGNASFCGTITDPNAPPTSFMSDYYFDSRQAAVYEETPRDHGASSLSWGELERVPAPGPMVNVADVRVHEHNFVVNVGEPCGGVTTFEPTAVNASATAIGWTDAIDQFWNIRKWSDPQSRFPTRVSDDGPIMFCGTLQRQLVSTVSCLQTHAAMPVGVDTLPYWDGTVNVHNGAHALDCTQTDPENLSLSLSRCVVEGPVEFVPTCPIGTCSASGVCVGARAGDMPLGVAPTVAVIPQGILWAAPPPP
jgi:hypothetical protein